MINFKYLFYFIIALSLSGCLGGNNNLRGSLPDFYIKCEHFYDGQTFKYEEKNVTLYPNSFCIIDRCVDQIEIKDLDGKTWFFNSLEFENEWICREIE